MITIKLYGQLAQEFSDEYRLAVESPAEAIHALTRQLPGFGQTFRDGYYRISVDQRPITDDHLGEQLACSFGRADTLHIMPVAAGDGFSGFGSILAGAAVMAFAAPVIGAVAAVGIGAGLVVAGISEYYIDKMMPDQGASEPVDQRPSYIYNGPKNTASEGMPIPVIYGEVVTGSIVVSSSLTVEQLDPRDDD